MVFLSCTVTKEKDEITEPFSINCEEAQYVDWNESDYVLPYPVGNSYFIGLSSCGGSYHSEGLPDQFAIDFNMNIGDTITAVRKGLVVYIEESGFDGSFPNNLVIVEHEDGTFAQYMHLTNNGAEVEINDEVEQGSVIGYSGNTGLAGYPHLHLVVTNKGSYEYPYTSLPINFKNTEANERGPVSGTGYEAMPY